MADRVPRLKVVPPGDFPPTRRRAPGAAVVLVLLYGLIFGGGLWLIRPRKRAAAAPPAAHPALSTVAPRHDAPASDTSLEASARRRGEILAGAAIPIALRPRYLARLAADHCDCGCDLTLQACLARDAACSRSFELAREIGTSLR